MGDADITGAEAPAPRPNRLLSVVCAAFFAMGMAQASIGPALPDLARQTHAGIVAAGGALSALFAGSLVGYTAAGLLIARLGRRWIMIVGMVLFVTGSSGLAASTTLPLLLAAAGCMGLGVASVVLAGNVIAAEASAGAGPLNLVNGMYGVGAITAPALIGASMTALGTGIPALWTVPCAMTVALLLLLVWAPRPERTRWRQNAALTAGTPPSRAALGAPLIWLICGFMFAYISVEIGISGWLPTLLQRATPLSPAASALALSWTWLLMTGVRFGAAWASRFISPVTMIRVCVGVSIAGGVTLTACALSGSPVLGLAAASVFGLALGPIVPSLLALVRASFPRDPGAVTGVVMAVGSVGGAVVPWLLGALTVTVGPVVGTAFLLALPILMALLLAAIGLQGRRGGSSLRGLEEPLTSSAV